MADYTIINGTDEELEDVNAADEDVAAGATATGIALDGTELAALLLIPGVFVTSDAASADEIGLGVVAAYAEMAAQLTAELEQETPDEEVVEAYQAALALVAAAVEDVTGSTLVSDNLEGEVEVINATGEEVGGVPAYSNSVEAMTPAALATLLEEPGVAVLSDGWNSEQRRLAAKMLKLGGNPGA